MAPTQPIPIATPGSNQRNSNDASAARGRRLSLSSLSTSTGSPGSSPEVTTPSSPSNSWTKSLPSSSPFMSYFSQQHKSASNNITPSASNSMPFRRPWQNPVFEEDEVDLPTPSVSPHHVRRASTQYAGRFSAAAAQANNPPNPEVAAAEKGTSLLRRLSLGPTAAFKPSATGNAIPNPPPNPVASATSPNSQATTGFRATRAKTRAATISVPRAPRAPSPMGERILKGQFDGFN